VAVVATEVTEAVIEENIIIILITEVEAEDITMNTKKVNIKLNKKVLKKKREVTLFKELKKALKAVKEAEVAVVATEATTIEAATEVVEVATINKETIMKMLMVSL
jgi:hypothetical protein